MVFLAALPLLLVVGTRPNRLRDRVSRPFVKTLPQEFGTRPAEVHPFLLAAALRYRGNPAVFLYLGRTPIPISLRTQRARLPFPPPTTPPPTQKTPPTLPSPAGKPFPTSAKTPHLNPPTTYSAAPFFPPPSCPPPPPFFVPAVSLRYLASNDAVCPG